MLPLAIDLFCGLGGWTEGLLSEGYYVVGFDNECHQYGDHKYPAQLVLQDVLTLHGRQFKDAALIVASPPCQAYSYRAMPWKKAKALPPPDNTLFEACFRIQLEASEAAGHHVPMVVENVRGANPWVGRSRWNYGSFHLWGDVPALMPIVKRHAKVSGLNWSKFGTPGYKAKGFNTTADQNCRDGIKNPGGSWFSIGSPRQKETNRNPTRNDPRDGIKNGSRAFPNDCADQRGMGRKRASAMIAKIPLELARYIGRTYYPAAKRERG